MHRRQFLALAGASLIAGCSTSPRENSESPSTDRNVTSSTPTPANDESANLFGSASIVDLKTGPRTLSLPSAYRGPDGGVVKLEFTATATAEHPATLRATLKNQNDWENTFALQNYPPFQEVTYSRLRPYGFAQRFEESNSRSRSSSSSSETALYLAPTENHELVDTAQEYTRGSEGFWRTPSVPTKLPPTVTLDPGEKVVGEYYVLGHWDRRGFPTGTYSFNWSDSGFNLIVWETTNPGPTTDSRFSGPVPELPTGKGTPWFHEATSQTKVYLEPSAERTDLPRELAFRLVNHSREPVTGNPYRWALYKLVGGRWYKIAPWMVVQPLTAVMPGDAYGYALHLFHGRGLECDERDAHYAVSVGHLGGGRYAFESGFSRSGGQYFAAQFDVDAPEVDVTPSEDATVQRRDSRTIVTLPGWDDSRQSQNATLTVRRVENLNPDREFIAEQILQPRYRVLRNALAVVSESTNAVVRAEKHLVESVVEFDQSRLDFRFRGKTYRATADLSPS